MEKEKDFGSHWCEALFPPTYTSEDLLKNSDEEKTKHEITEDLYSRMYSQVLLEEADVPKSLKDECVESEVPSSDYDTHCKNHDHEGIWNLEDMKVFKKAYADLKARAIKLICILESKNLKITQLKNQNKELERQVAEKEELNVELLKQNFIMKEYTRSHEKITNDLERKLQFYEDCNNELKEVISKRDKDLRKAKSLYTKEHQINQDSMASINKLKECYRVELILAKESMRKEYSRGMDSLNKEISDLQITKRNIEIERDRFKSSFLSLQKHFLSNEIQ